MSEDPAAPIGRYGAADIVTKKSYRDFRLHREFLVMHEGGNSGVYPQNRYEIQIQDGVKTKHGMGAVINEAESPYHAYRGLRQWSAYDLVFRAARFRDGQLVDHQRAGTLVPLSERNTRISMTVTSQHAGFVALDLLPQTRLTVFARVMTTQRFLA